MTVGLPRSQRGISLLVTLVMLVVMTLLVVSAIRAGNANLKTTANLQVRQEAIHAAQSAIEQTLSNMSNFSTPTARTINVSVDGGSTVYQVNVAAPTCLFSVPVGGYSIEFAASAPNDTFWDLRATTTDPATGAKATVHQGAKIRVDPTVIC